MVFCGFLSVGVVCDSELSFDDLPDNFTDVDFEVSRAASSDELRNFCEIDRLADWSVFI